MCEVEYRILIHYAKLTTSSLRIIRSKVGGIEWALSLQKCDAKCGRFRDECIQSLRELVEESPLFRRQDVLLIPLNRIARLAGAHDADRSKCGEESCRSVARSAQ